MLLSPSSLCQISSSSSSSPSKLLAILVLCRSMWQRAETFTNTSVLPCTIGSIIWNGSNHGNLDKLLLWFWKPAILYWLFSYSLMRPFHYTGLSTTQHAEVLRLTSEVLSQFLLKSYHLRVAWKSAHFIWHCIFTSKFPKSKGLPIL